MVRATHLAGVGGTCTSALIDLAISLAAFQFLYFPLPLSPRRARLFPFSFLHNEAGHALTVSNLALSSWMAGYDCNVVFGNHHGLFLKNGRAQIHSVGFMSFNISFTPFSIG